jgi:nucleoside 2-deoxyribosyltransferase
VSTDYAKKYSLNTKEIIDRIFKDPGTKYELIEFKNLGKPIYDILSIYSKTASTERDALERQRESKQLLDQAKSRVEQLIEEAGQL